MNGNKNLTVIDGWDIPSKEERETIISYDEKQSSWHIYTDVPKHARKYEHFIDDSQPHRKGYSTNGGKLAMIDGYIAGANVTIAKKRTSTMTDDQKEQARKRMKELHKKKRG